MEQATMVRKFARLLKYAVRVRLKIYLSFFFFVLIDNVVEDVLK